MTVAEINEIRRQFKCGRKDGEWKQFINSIKVTNIHGWSGQEVQFRFPVVAIVGENGIGKSTFLKAAACAYKNRKGETFYPSRMFVSTQWDETALTDATIEYEVRQGNTEMALKWKKTKAWGFTPKTNKPERSVFFLDISRTLPLDAAAGYARIAKLANEEAGSLTVLSQEYREGLSYVLGKSYDGARFTATDVNTKREVGLLEKAGEEISQFHQGAGEDSILDMFKLLQDIPKQSLLIIDEVENSLHPQAQRRFIHMLLRLSRVKKLQIILSTHSPFVLDELPDDARIMLMQLSDKKEVVYGVSTNFALSIMDTVEHPDVYAFLEDREAASLFWEVLKQDKELYPELTKKIAVQTVGSCEVIKTLNKLSRSNRLPYKSFCVIDGDKKNEVKDCLAFPGSSAPERQVLQDLKEKGWNNLDCRFGVGAGTLFKVLDDVLLIPDHHKWTEEIGNQIKRSKDAVWEILIQEWCSQCLDAAVVDEFVGSVKESLRG